MYYDNAAALAQCEQDRENEKTDIQQDDNDYYRPQISQKMAPPSVLNVKDELHITTGNNAPLIANFKVKYKSIHNPKNDLPF